MAGPTRGVGRLSVLQRKRLTRRIAGSAPAMVTTFHTGLMGTILTTVAILPLWEAPTPAQWGLLFLIGLIATAPAPSSVLLYG